MVSYNSEVFQSTPLREGRPACARRKGTIRGDFNPRPSVRGDARVRARTSRATNFNPRPSVRGDEYLRETGQTQTNFNPRPSVRGDREAPSNPRFLQSFQSTPLREGRLTETARRRRTTNFNPRPSVRGDSGAVQPPCFPPHFNPRPSVRGDIKSNGIWRVTGTFQSTPLREGRPGRARCRLG